jgi:ABC-2 type transport system permease protein
MRTILFILQKEFKQILRNRVMLPIIFIIPLVQTLVLVYAATLELKEAKISIMDFDNSPMSRRLCADFIASPFFSVDVIMPDNMAIAELLLTEQSKAVVVIPQDLEYNIMQNIPAKIQVNIDAVDGQSAGIINIYVQQIVNRMASESTIIPVEVAMQKMPVKAEIRSRFWYNPTLNFKHFMLPGILVILVTMMGSFLSALNLVREKELGTIEQINVTPIKKWQFLVGKLLPFWIIGLVVLGVGLLIGIFIFNMPFVGSVWTLLLFTGLYLFAAIGLGLLVSDFARTQQQAMFTIFFFFLIFVLMGGIFTSVESMPHWAQEVNRINPLFYFMKAIRAILLKGAGVKQIASELISISVYGVLVMIIAVWRYRKTS